MSEWSLLDWIVAAGAVAAVLALVFSFRRKRAGAKMVAKDSDGVRQHANGRRDVDITAENSSDVDQRG